MGVKYCPNCKEVVVTKVLQNYSQVDFKGVPGKRRKIVHLEEDGGCGHEWYTVEVAEDVLGVNGKTAEPQIIYNTDRNF